MKKLNFTNTAFLLFSILTLTSLTARAGTNEVLLETTIHTESEHSGSSTNHASKTREHWLEIHASSPVPADGLKLRWTLYAAELQRGADHIVVEKSGESSLSLPGESHWVSQNTAKVPFTWVPAHGETTGTGRRARGHRVEESGHRYYGFKVEVLSGDTVLASAVSQQSLLKTE
jgi:hypothetical protein